MFINSIHLLHSHRAGELQSQEKRPFSIQQVVFFGNFLSLFLRARVHSPLNFAAGVLCAHVCVWGQKG